MPSLTDLLSPEPWHISNADYANVRLVPFPYKTWQLQGHVPDMAVLAYDEAAAREQIAALLGRPLTAKDILTRIR